MYLLLLLALILASSAYIYLDLLLELNLGLETLLVDALLLELTKCDCWLLIRRLLLTLTFSKLIVNGTWKDPVSLSIGTMRLGAGVVL